MSDNEENVFMEYVKLLSLLSAGALMVLWVLVILVSFFSSFGEPEQNVMDRSAVLERLKAVEVVAVKGEARETEAAAPSTVAVAEKPTAEAAPAAAGEIDGNAIATATCVACHAIGLLESPKVGDKAAWEKRIQANGDMDGLVKSAIVGKGAMPPRGGNAGLSDAEVKAAIEFMMQ